VKKKMMNLILDFLPIISMVTLDLTDGYTTNDIIYEWGPSGVVVGNNEMAQFEYKSNNISSSIEEFSVGKYLIIYRAFLIIVCQKTKVATLLANHEGDRQPSEPFYGLNKYMWPTGSARKRL